MHSHRLRKHIIGHLELRLPDTRLKSGLFLQICTVSIIIVDMCFVCFVPICLTHPLTPPSSGQWECLSWFRVYGSMRLEHFVLALPGSHVPSLSKPGQGSVSPNPAPMFRRYSGHPLSFHRQHEQAHSKSRHFQGVVLFELHARMLPLTATNTLIASNRFSSLHMSSIFS